MAIHTETPDDRRRLETQVLEFGRRADLTREQTYLLSDPTAAIESFPDDLIHQKVRPYRTTVETGDEDEPYDQWTGDGSKEAEFRASRIRVTQNIARTVVSHAAFVEFLRDGGEELQKDLQFVNDMHAAYSDYKPLVDAIRYAETPPQVAGSGTNKNVYIVRDDNGRYVAIKFPHEHQEGKASERYANHVDVMAFARGNEVDGLEHMLAASPDDGVLITQAIEDGKISPQLTVEERHKIPDTHTLRLIQAVLQMHDRGLDFDPKMDNFIYSEKTGWTILDYDREAPNRRWQRLTPLAEKLAYAARAVAPLNAETGDEAKKKFFNLLKGIAPELARDTARAALGLELGQDLAVDPELTTYRSFAA